MNVKCKCNHCSTNIEFDSSQAGSIVVCPACGMETTLYIPVAVPAKQPPIAPVQPTSMEALKAIRAQSCYKTLRSLIDLLQVIIFVIAGIIAISAIFVLLNAFGIVGESNGLANGIIGFVLGIVIAMIVVIIGIALKQAAVLLIDIADCQIQGRM